MQDKHKLYLIAILLIVVLVLVVSSIFKAPKKVSSMLENKKNVQVRYNNDVNPEQMVTDENKLSDKQKDDVASD